jgi:hypothetical protein
MQFRCPCMGVPPRSRCVTVPTFARRYSISERACTQPRNALAGRADLRDDQPQELLRLVRWAGAWHPLDLLEGYHTPARGQRGRRTHQFCRGLPPSCRVVGLHQIDGMPLSPSVQDRLLGPLPGRRTSRSSEKPGEVARAFLLVNSTAPSRWRRWERVGGRAGL